jgi:hypothetical protein
MLAVLPPFETHLTGFFLVSDVTAVGLALASAQCDGPIVPIRAGRLDASVAGPPGVPRPEQTLEEHTESLSVIP